MSPGRPPGVEFHTFTVLGRCPRTGRLGIATATRSLAVGARVPHVRAALGAVAIMAIADARLGYMALRLLELGHKAPAVIEELVKGDPYAEYRQLGVIDADGFAAARFARGRGAGDDALRATGGHRSLLAGTRPPGPVAHYRGAGTRARRRAARACRATGLATQ